MPVPFGFGVGDFVAVGTLAWDVYKSCKGAPESFGKISIEVLSLHAVLKEAEETVLHHPLPFQSHARLETVYKGCQSVLEELQGLLKKYESLGTQSKRTWDRMRWGAKSIAEIRARLMSSISMLGVFLSHLEGDLDEIGISVTAFDANRDFILDWLVQAADKGAFNERATVANNDEGPLVQLDLTSALALSSRLDPGCATPYPSDTDSDHETMSVAQQNDTFESRLRTFQDDIGSLPSIPVITDSRDLPSPLRVVRRPPEKPITVSTIFAETQSPTKKQLLHSINKGDSVAALDIIHNTARISYVSPGSLFFALQDAIERKLPMVVAALIANGADVNRPWSHHSVTLRLTFSNWTPLCKARHRHDTFDILLNSGADANARLNHSGETSFTLLHLAAARHDCFAVRKLMEHGADVNGHSAYGSPLMLALTRPAFCFCADLLIELGADVNYSREPDRSSNRILCPLDVAIVGSSISLIFFLLDKGATVLPHNVRMAHALVEGDLNNIPSVYFSTKKPTPKNDYGTSFMYLEDQSKSIVEILEHRLAQDSTAVQKSVIRDRPSLGTQLGTPALSEGPRQASSRPASKMTPLHTIASKLVALRPRGRNAAILAKPK